MTRPATPESIEEAKKLARQFSDICNGNRMDLPTFVEQITRFEHRTLQQREMAVMWACIAAWAKQDQPGHFDARNENTVRLCRRIVDAVGVDQFFAYI